MNDLTTINGVAVPERRAPRPVAGWAASPRRNESTQKAYERRVTAFYAWLDDQGIIDPTAADVERFAAELVAAGRTAFTVNGYLAAVRGYFKHLQKTRQWPDITVGVEGCRIDPGHHKNPLTLAQVRRVLNTTDSLRDRAMLALMFTTGLRSVEVARANIGGIHNQSGCTVLDVHGKGHASADDFVVVPEHVADLLFTYLQTRGATLDDSPLFAGQGNRNAGGRLTTRQIRRIVTSAFQRANCYGAKVSTHSTRHTAINLALDAGATLQEVQQMARHRSIQTTMVYARARDRVEARTEARVAGAIFGIEDRKDTFSDIGGAA